MEGNLPDPGPVDDNSAVRRARTDMEDAASVIIDDRAVRPRLAAEASSVSSANLRDRHVDEELSEYFPKDVSEDQVDDSQRY